MHKLEFVQENKSNKILWDFEIQTDHIITGRRPDLVVITKKKKKKKGRKQKENFIVPADHRVKIKEKKKTDK